MNQRWEQLINDCRSDLKAHNVKVTLSPHKTVEVPGEGVRTAGYWDDTEDDALELSVARGNTKHDWREIFTHEYCHFCQWKEKPPVWVANAGQLASDSGKIFHNKPISRKLLNLIMDTSRDIEADCEKRTVKLFKQYGVPVDFGKYIREANIYIHFYNHAKEYRSWFPEENPPYRHPALVGVAAGTFYKSYKTIPKELAKAFRKHYPVPEKNNILP